MLDRLEHYLDGLLTGEDLRTFERELAASVELRAHVEMQRRADTAMRASLSPPTAIALPSLDAAVRAADSSAPPEPIKITAARAAQPRHPLHFTRWIGYAAAAVIGIAGVLWWSSTVPNPEARRVLTAMEVFRETEKTGFKPVFVCKDDAEFAATVKGRFGTPLLVAAQQGIAVLGWAYSDSYDADIITKNTLVLMARVDGKEVLVFMDRAGAFDRTTPRELGLGDRPDGRRLFKRTLDGLVLYELTPFETPRVLEAAYVPR